MVDAGEGLQTEENALDPFGGFALDALFDETDNVDVVVLDSQESESECEDEDEELSNFQAAWFKAKDIEETKDAAKTSKDDS